mgnify:CR=1 FL=1
MEENDSFSVAICFFPVHTLPFTHHIINFKCAKLRNNSKNIKQGEGDSPQRQQYTLGGRIAKFFLGGLVKYFGECDGLKSHPPTDSDNNTLANGVSMIVLGGQ